MSRDVTANLDAHLTPCWPYP